MSTSCLHCTIPIIKINQAVVLWSHHGTSCNTNSNSHVTTSFESSSERTTLSRETQVVLEPTDSPPSNRQQLESPYYVVSPPTHQQHWGMYPSIPSCPPPQVSYAQQPQQQQQQQNVQIPTPLYVTFSDGTTMLVPTQRIHDSTQQQQNPPSIHIYLMIMRLL